MIVYLSLNQLKAFSKNNLTPFVEENGLNTRMVKTKKTIVTTVGQLNFFKWALENGIISYIETHLEDIEKDMNYKKKHKEVITLNLKKG